ncbi:MAG TPA: DUF4058 family protein [Gemmataceae bacterium]|nr:DUF4058 family protein [Gemmataceae bacterium]
MPSPFPGMDPYLEGSLWTTVHAQLSSEIARQLAPRLRPRYLALMTERFVMDSADDVAVMRTSIYPDVGVAEAEPGPPVGGTAVATAPVRLATVMPTPVPHVSVEIRDTANRELVTAIEVLSPTNKRGEGRLEYLAKRQRLLLSTAHLVEIDLLHQGRRVPMQQALPPAPYYVLVGRAETRPLMDVWSIPLGAPLPVIGIPLLPGDPDVALDLQLALTTVYDVLGYDLAVNYAEPPEVPLPAAEAEWLDQRLRAAGLRDGAKANPA